MYVIYCKVIDTVLFARLKAEALMFVNDRARHKNDFTIKKVDINFDLIYKSKLICPSYIKLNGRHRFVTSIENTVFIHNQWLEFTSVDIALFIDNLKYLNLDDKIIDTMRRYNALKGFAEAFLAKHLMDLDSLYLNSNVILDEVIKKHTGLHLKKESEELR